MRTATAQLGRVRAVTWRWRRNVPADVQPGPGVGVLAQELERVFPELVTTRPDGFKQVHYAGLIGPLIEAVRELDARLTALEQPGDRSRGSAATATREAAGRCAR